MKKWNELLNNILEIENVNHLKGFIKTERLSKKVLPMPEMMFNAFNLCPIENIKMIIIGNEPLESKYKPNGLSFSSGNDIVSPEFESILMMLKTGLYSHMNNEQFNLHFRYGNLERWAKNGALMLNERMTTIQDSKNAHINIGWEYFTEHILNYISTNLNNIAFVFLNDNSERYINIPDKSKHFVCSLKTSNNPMRDALNYLVSIQSKADFLTIDLKAFVDVKNLIDKVEKELADKLFQDIGFVGLDDKYKNKPFREYIDEFMKKDYQFNFINVFDFKLK